MNNMYHVIMCGGVGSRFWPMSTTKTPKQFLKLVGDKSLFRLTVDRLLEISKEDKIILVTSKKYKKIILEELPEIPEENILCEPAMRNTAPCVAYAAFKIQSLNKNANMIIAASDHIITKENEFIKVVNDCFELTAKNDILLTLGMKPSRPDTGYGYIQFINEKVRCSV